MSGLDPTLQIMAKAMTLRLQRHSAIAGNIANADTPGYRPKAVGFEDKLQKVVAQKNYHQLGRVEGKVREVDDGLPKPDGNSVNVDKQMAELNENSVIYSATAEFVGRKLKMMKMVLQ